MDKKLRKDPNPNQWDLMSLQTEVGHTSHQFSHTKAPTTSKYFTGMMKFGFFLADWMRDDDRTCPAHSMSIRGLSTGINCRRFNSLIPQNRTWRHDQIHKYIVVIIKTCASISVICPSQSRCFKFWFLRVSFLEECLFGGKSTMQIYFSNFMNL